MFLTYTKCHMDNSGPKVPQKVKLSSLRCSGSPCHPLAHPHRASQQNAGQKERQVDLGKPPTAFLNRNGQKKIHKILKNQQYRREKIKDIKNKQIDKLNAEEMR